MDEEPFHPRRRRSPRSASPRNASSPRSHSPRTASSPRRAAEEGAERRAPRHLHHHQRPAAAPISIVNTSGLEELLRRMGERLDRQDDEIARMREDLRSRPSHHEMAALKRSVDERLDGVEARMAAAEREAAEAADALLRTRAHMNELLDLVESKADGRAFAEAEATARVLGAEVQRLARDKVDRSQVEDTVAAQQRAAQKLVAVEGLLATKIDRGEVPLLRAAASKVQGMAEFAAGTQRRLKALEAAARRLEAEKENKTDAVSRSRRVSDALQSKCDVDFVKTNVLERISHIDKAVGLSSRVREFVAQYQHLPKRLAATEAKVRLLQRDIAASQKQQLEDADRVAEGALRAISEHVEDVNACKDALYDLENERREQNRYLAEVKAAMSGVRDSHLVLDKKVTVALRFVDWFTDARTGGGAGAPPAGIVA